MSKGTGSVDVNKHLVLTAVQTIAEDSLKDTMTRLIFLCCYICAACAMNAMAETHNLRHTITINDQAFLKLRNRGRFGESYSEVILRILDQAERA